MTFLEYFFNKEFSKNLRFGGYFICIYTQGAKIQSCTWMKLFCILSPSEFEFEHIQRMKTLAAIITIGGLLRLEREICIPSFQQGCKYSSSLKQTAPEMQGQHSVRPRKK